MRKSLALLPLILVFAFPQTVAASSTVAIGSVSPSGSSLHVSGTSSYADQPWVSLGTDPLGDAFHVDAQGGDVVEVWMSTTAAGGTRLHWGLHVLPEQTNGGPTIMYGWDFCVNGESCFEMNLQRFTLVTPGTAPHAVLWRCADPSCSPGGQTRVQTGGMPITFDASGKTVTVTLPAVAGAVPETTISGVTQDANGPAFTAIGTADPFTAQYDLGDGVALVEDYVVPGKQVSLALAPRGLDPAEVAYTSTVTPAASGSWSGSLSTGGQSGALAVYARACLGAGNCGYASSNVTL